MMKELFNKIINWLLELFIFMMLIVFTIIFMPFIIITSVIEDYTPADSYKKF